MINLPVGPCVAACAPLSLAASEASPCLTRSTSGCRGGCAVAPVVVVAAEIVVAVAAAAVVAVADLTRCGCDCSETASEGPLGAGALAAVLAASLEGGKQEGRRLSWARFWIGRLELLVERPVPPEPLVLHDTLSHAVLLVPERIFVMTENEKINYCG